MRRSGDSAASLTRMIGGMALAGTHAAITGDPLQLDSQPPHSTSTSHTVRGATGPHAHRPDVFSGSNAAEYADNRRPLSPEASYEFENEADGYSQGDVGRARDRHDAQSDAPETVPADGPGPSSRFQPPPGSPDTAYQDPSATPPAVNIPAMHNGSSSRLGRPTSAYARPTAVADGGFSFSIVASPRHESANAEGGVLDSGGVLPSSIAAFRPDPAPQSQQSAAGQSSGGYAAGNLAVNRKQVLPNGPRAGAAGVQHAEADWALAGLPPRPVQVQMHHAQQHRSISHCLVWVPCFEPCGSPSQRDVMQLCHALLHIAHMTRPAHSRRIHTCTCHACQNHMLADV